MILEVIFIAAGLLVLLVLVVGGIFCIPVQVRIEFNSAHRPLFQLKSTWRGSSWPEFSTSNLGVKNSNKKCAKKKTNKPEGKSISTYIPYMLKAAPRIISRVAAQIKIDAISAHIVFGLSDPAETGVLYGALIPFTISTKASCVSLQPNYNDVILEGHGRLVVYFRPIALVLPVLSFTWAVFVAPRLSKIF